MKKYITLYANVFVVKGASNSLIYSYNSNRIFSISNALADFTGLFKTMTVPALLDLNKEIKKNVTDFFDFLIANDLAFYNTHRDNFTDMPDQYESPAIVENAIIEIDSSKIDIASFKEMIFQLSNLGVEYLELRFYQEETISTIDNYLSCLKNSNIAGVDILMKYCIGVNDNLLEQLVLSHQRVANVYVHSANSNRYLNDSEFTLGNDMGKIYYLEEKIDSQKCCGQINKNSLSLDSMGKFILGRKHNSCLYKKISIDVEGNIKNCPSKTEAFGNIKDVSLIEAIQKVEFKKYWSISKDKIHVCKDCEFRYMCTDCRAYIENPEDIFSKPLKCGYNPYTGEWAEWKKDPIKQKVINHYKL